jgi:hypothetical protein
VLPGPHEAPPPVEQKIAAISGKHAANSYETKIPLLFRYFQAFESVLNGNKNAGFFLLFLNFMMFWCEN